MKKRCEWAGKYPLMMVYHDKEWGILVHDCQLLFEFLILEGAQAALSWMSILKKRENYRKVFSEFNPAKLAYLTADKIEKLLTNQGIVRNRLKVDSIYIKVKAFLKIKDEFESFDKYIWQFLDDSPIQNKWKSLKQIPAKTKKSDAISKDLKKRDFKIVGSTICYAFMQALGMVNDHTVDYFRYSI
jgi:DNA-3-methyladenine glycosylase I|tara:strand:+ start:244 stop:801 length:558 start_codon:yes stop_codon:yes gene_type:complete